MKYILLSQGKKAIVDDDRYKALSYWNWFINSNGYAVRNRLKGEIGKSMKYMHRIVNSTPEGLHTDHINGNKLDNRKKNLRTVTISQNNRNQIKLRSDNTTGYRGVYWDNKIKKFYSQIRINGRSKTIALTNTAEEAKAARLKYIKENGLEYFND